jgi:teichuronic acid biosynthesis glycosyltransferase TuaH
MRYFCLIISASDPWRVWHRQVFIDHIATALESINGYILVLEPPIFSVYTLIKYPKRLLEWLKGDYKFRKVRNNVWSVAPFTLEHILLSERFSVLRFINKILLKIQIRKYLKVIGVSPSNSVLMLHRPELRFLKNVFPECKTIYDCWDEFTVTYDDNKYKVAGNKEREEEFSRSVDLIITNSTKLNDKLIKFNPNTFEVVCAFSEKVFFSGANIKIPSMESLAKPIIGYIGNIRNWIDFSLVEYLIKKRPHWNIVFSGTIKDESRRIIDNLVERYSNFTVTGTVPYNLFPSYLSYFDVGIIPFVQNEFIYNTNPNKFYEYLGARIPVVSVPIDHIEKHFSEISRIAVTQEDFLASIEYYLNLEPAAKDKLMNSIEIAATENTWEKRTDLFVRLLERFILNPVSC